jgi:GntR family transcriptional regulator/MocR family aminotransferase
MINLDRASPEPLHEQLYRQIRNELESGAFSNGLWRLPSSRSLATDLNVSRFTVKLALEQLRTEGYLRTLTGSGTFVADLLPRHYLQVQRARGKEAPHGPGRIAERVKNLTDQRSGAQLDVGVAGPPGNLLVAGIPAVDEFPLGTWEKLRSKVLARKGAHLLRYSASHGDPDLRKAIAAYVCDFRGVRCTHEQVVIVSGMQQAMMVAACALVNPGESIWIEDPGYRQARNVFGFSGARIVPRPLDAEGMTLEKKPTKTSPRLIFVTPTAQFPLGMTMTPERRSQLIRFAQKQHSYLMEDDYLSEFWFSRPPLPSLQGMDDSGHVIYAGTMSKILYPSLRLGYLIVPEEVIDAVIKTRSVIDLHSSPIDQATLARFISEGFFLRHVKRVRNLYLERRQFFIEEFNRLLSDRFRLQVPEAGLHLVAWWHGKKDWSAVLQAIQGTRAKPNPLHIFAIKAQLEPGLVFGFAAWTPAQIRQALQECAERW